ncbi:hypothetical protein ACHAW6_012496 [Cyclotella cf. meneghiniana]
MIIDFANFYLMTPLKQPKFAKPKLSDIPEESFTIMSSTKKPHLMDGYTFNAFMACMAFRKLAVLYTTSWNTASIQPGINRAILFPVCGNTTHIPSNSHLLSTTLLTNTPPTAMPTTSLTLSNATMTSPWTPQEQKCQNHP